VGFNVPITRVMERRVHNSLCTPLRARSAFLRVIRFVSASLRLYLYSRVVKCPEKSPLRFFFYNLKQLQPMFIIFGIQYADRQRCYALQVFYVTLAVFAALAENATE